MKEARKSNTGRWEAVRMEEDERGRQEEDVEKEGKKKNRE